MEIYKDCLNLVERQKKESEEKRKNRKKKEKKKEREEKEKRQKKEVLSIGQCRGLVVLARIALQVSAEEHTETAHYSNQHRYVDHRMHTWQSLHQQGNR